MVRHTSLVVAVAVLACRSSVAVEYAKEGERCNGSLPPEYAVLCEDGLVCKTKTGLLGAWGTCGRPQTEDKPRPALAKEGDRCNGSLPPHRAVLCEGTLVCKSSGLLGAWGVCTAVGRPTLAKEGERCNGSLPPRFAVLCAGGLQCTTSAIGGWGQCASPAKPVERAAEGDKCNGSLPPEYAVTCRAGLTCESRALLGGWGVCRPAACKNARCAVAASGIALVGAGGLHLAPWALLVAAIAGLAAALGGLALGRRSMMRAVRRWVAVVPAPREGYVLVE